MWCSRSIYSEDKDEFADVGGERRKIGSRVVYRLSLEWMEFNLRCDRIKPRDWAEARDWVMMITSWSTEAPVELERQQDAVSANLARHHEWWAKCSSARAR